MECIREPKAVVLKDTFTNTIQNYLDILYRILTYIFSTSYRNIDTIINIITFVCSFFIFICAEDLLNCGLSCICRSVVEGSIHYIV